MYRRRPRQALLHWVITVVILGTARRRMHFEDGGVVRASAQSQSHDSAYPCGDRTESGIERISGELSVGIGALARTANVPAPARRHPSYPTGCDHAAHSGRPVLAEPIVFGF